MFNVDRASYTEKMLANLKAKKEKEALLLEIRSRTYKVNERKLNVETNEAKNGVVADSVKTAQLTSSKVCKWDMISDEDQSGMLIPAKY